MATYVWGVDSAARVTDTLYDCVVSNYGKPKFWGRYLTTVPQVSDGLSQEEIQFLHQQEIKVMPIYNVFREALGYRNGQLMARNAIFHAQSLGFPKDIFIFANIEHFFLVDEAWIRGWVDVMYNSGYRPGLYHDPTKGSFSEAYCLAAQNSATVKSQAVLWSAEPEIGVSSKQKAPTFAPALPPCTSLVWAWQYGRESSKCPIDTNLITNQLFNRLW
jgi:hypothetical protein